MNLYEGMFLLDNNVVREDWNNAKGTATGILEKHGASVSTARRWAERSLAYTIKKRNRGTYLLVHFEVDPGSISIVCRDLELNSTVMRYLILGADEVPETERELHDAELSSDFTVPEPPEDHVVDGADEEEGEAPRGDSRPEGDASPSEDDSAAKAPAADAPAADAPAADAPAADAPAADAPAADAPAADATAADEPAADEPAADATAAEEPAAEAPAAEATESGEEQTEAKASEEG